MNVEEVIETALFGSVRDLDVVEADHKAWPNVSFRPPTDAYVRVDHLPNGNERLFIQGDDPHLYLGILQLTVIAPQNAGPSEAKRIAGDIAASYPADREIDDSGITLRVQKAPDVAREFLDDATWNVPVSIRYEAYARPGWYGEGHLDFSIAGNSQYLSLIQGH